jgi:hypothetical protein
VLIQAIELSIESSLIFIAIALGAYCTGNIRRSKLGQPFS